MHALQQLLIDLGLSRADTFEPYYPRVRDRTDVAAIRCNLSGVIVLDRCDHIDVGHYVARASHATSICLSEDAPAMEVSLPVLLPNDDDRRRADTYLSLITDKDWLDVGTGAGGILPLLAPAARTVAVVEPSAGCRSTLEAHGYKCSTRISEIEAESCHVATAFHVIEHFTDPLAELELMRRALRPGGLAVIEVPHARDLLLEELDCEAFRAFTLWSEHLLLHTRESLTRLLAAAGFQDIVVRGLQRYPLANHLHWLARSRPGGHHAWSWLDSPDLATAYESALGRIDRTDTLVAIARE